MSPHSSSLENLMDGGAWWATVHGVTKSRTWLSYFTFTFYFHALEKEMATHSCVLAWRIPGMGEPGGLPSLGSHRARHDWSNLAAAVAGARLKGCDLGRLSTDHSPYSWAVSPFLKGYLSYVFLCLLQFSIERTIFLSFFLDYINSPCAS